MTGIGAFIAARLDEDEQIAQAATKDPGGRVWRASDSGVYPDDNQSNHPGSFINGPYDHLDPGVGTHVAHHDPDRVLREVAAKRTLLADHRPVEERMSWDEYWTICGRCRYDQGLDVFAFPCPTVRALASVWVDHSDFDPAWAVQ